MEYTLDEEDCERQYPLAKILNPLTGPILERAGDTRGRALSRPWCNALECPAPAAASGFRSDFAESQLAGLSLPRELSLDEFRKSTFVERDR